MIEASVICDSISPQGKRLTTFRLRYPKFIHGEFLTHRVISRNASSSRAVPTSKLIQEVRDDALRAGPVFWGKNQKGMQAAEELSNESDGCESDKGYAQRLWADAARSAADFAEDLAQSGVNKQIVNRLLEPFSHINVVATATEWDNFFGLRLHKDAQPEMRALAITMWGMMQRSIPRLLKPGQWHLPFIQEEDIEVVQTLLCDVTTKPVKYDPLIQISVARCARVSYESFESGKRSTIQEDLKLYDRLLGAQLIHASPAEHQATPDTGTLIVFRDGEKTWTEINWDSKQGGNFVGWRQYRKILPGEAVAPIPEEFR